MLSYAGNAEDVSLLRAIAGCRGGFFVDIGAGEPDSRSVTRNLVHELGWSGANAEPLPNRYTRLVAAKPGDVNLHVAMGTVPGRARFTRWSPARGKLAAACPLCWTMLQTTPVTVGGAAADGDP